MRRKSPARCFGDNRRRRWSPHASPALGVTLLLAGSLVFAIVIVGIYMHQPNKAAAKHLFGSNSGTDRTTGLRWVVPWYGKKKLSVRANNIISD